MIIELQRAFTPEEMFETECGACGVEFRCESVIAQVMTDYRMDMGRACPECVAFMGRRNPQRFPTIEEYEAAKEYYPEPIWSTVEDAERAELEGGFEAVYAASWISREGGPFRAHYAERRARELLKRSDLLAGAIEGLRAGIEAEKDPDYKEYLRDKVVPFLEAEMNRVNEEVDRYKEELGLKD